MYNQILFTNVLRLMDELDISRQELAEKAGVSVSFLSDLTNGKANPSLKVMESIALALETPLPTLLEMTDLDQDSLEILAGRKIASSLPDGYVRVSVILPRAYAYEVIDRGAATLKKIRGEA